MKQIRDALLYFSAGAVAVAAFGLYQVANATAGQRLAEYYYRIAHHEESVLNANTLTIQTSIASTIILCFFLDEKSVFKKWGGYFLAYVFLLGVTFFTFSKGGWAGFVIGTASSLMLNAKRIGFMRLAASSLAFAAAVFLALSNIPFLEKIPEAVVHRLSEGQMTGSLQRIDYFEDVFRLLFMEPPVVLFTGAGFKNYIYMFHEKHQFFAPGDNSHNLLSYLIFGSGFSGAVLICALFGSMFRAAFKCRRALQRLDGYNGSRTLHINMFISWLSVSVWFSFISAYPIFHHTFWIFAGVAGRFIYDVAKGKKGIDDPGPAVTSGSMAGLDLTGIRRPGRN
ncbi:MAG: hypothetical protein HY891_03795 [Deltaproteobacteria bacterium]|nr:hypothetical protein [Deltaproteobacteria bacterium]